MKTIVITSFHQLISRNILATDILRLLIKDGMTRVVILCPKFKIPFFKSEFVGTGIFVQGVDFAPGRIDRLLRYLALAVLKTKSLELKRAGEMQGAGNILSAIFGNSAVARAIMRFLNSALLTRSRFAGTIIESVRPDVLFATDVQNDIDVRLMTEAKKRGVTVVGMVRSWDNLTAKGLVRAVPDKLMVNSQLIASQAREFHGISEHKISVVGIPHYDQYIREKSMTKEALCGSIGCDPGKRIVMYAPIGDRYLADNTVDGDVIEILDGYLGKDFMLHVRLPPGDSIAEIELGKRKYSSRVVLYRPGGHFDTVKNSELSREDDNLLHSTLQWSEVVVAGPSTICIDAALFDKPVILVGFDGFGTRVYSESVRRYYDYDHFIPIMSSGGALLADSAEILKSMLTEYLKDNNKDSIARKRLVGEQAYSLDAHSCERVVNCIRHGKS
jgi:hypothetical protein